MPSKLSVAVTIAATSATISATISAAIAVSNRSAPPALAPDSYVVPPTVNLKLSPILAPAEIVNRITISVVMVAVAVNPVPGVSAVILILPLPGLFA